MKKFLSVIAILSLVFSPVTPAFAATPSTWNVDGNGDWSAVGSWDAGGVPDLADWVANLTLPLSAPSTVSVDGAGTFTLGTLNIGDGSQDYTLSSSGGTLTFDVTAGNAAINQVALSGASKISAPILLNDSLDIANAAGSSLLISSNITANAAGTKTISNNGTNTGGVTLSGILADGGGGVVAVSQNSATSALTLSGTNTYTGDTLISAGTLKLGNNLALQNSALDTSGAGVVDVTGFTTPTFGGLKGNTNLASVITTGYGSVSSITLNLGTGVTDTYSGVIANGAAGMTLTKSGLGTQVLSGVNTFTGAVTVNQGTIQTGNTNAIGASNKNVTAVIVNSGGAVDFNGFVNECGYTIAGTGVGGTGALVNTGAEIGTGASQTANIKLSADATIGGTGNWALLTVGWGATSLDLNGFTLTKAGTNTFTLHGRYDLDRRWYCCAGG